MCCIKIGGFHSLIFLPWAEQILLKTYEDIGSVFMAHQVVCKLWRLQARGHQKLFSDFLVNYFELECRPVPNVMVTLPNIGIGGALCSTPPTVQVPCSNATKIRERKTWRMQSEFCTWQNSVTGQEPPKMYMYCTSPGDSQTPYKVWLTSVERRRCSNAAKTRNPFKCAGVPQTTGPIWAAVGRSSPYCEDMWRRY